jgi:hypothetical protein
MAVLDNPPGSSMGRSLPTWRHIFFMTFKSGLGGRPEAGRGYQVGSLQQTGDLVELEK